MIDMQLIGQIQQMMQRGAKWTEILSSLKSKGMSSQLIEDALCEAFPEIKKAKQAVQNSGMSTRQYLSQLAKQNNISQNQIDEMFGDFKKMLG